MPRRFPKRAFVPVGSLPATRLGLSASRSAELQLHRAWIRVAGPRLAAQAAAIGIRRGVLEIRMAAPDDAWSRTLDDLLPALAAAMAAEHPGWGIESVRLTDPSGDPLGEIQTLADPVPARPAARPRPAERDRKREPIPLERLMRAYLSRSGESSTD